MEKILKDCNDRMKGALDSLEHNLKTVRTGAANASILDEIQIDYYGSETPLNQLGSITVSEGKTLVIKPYDATTLKNIERAINESTLGLPPQNDGTVIRLTMPSLTEESRKDLCKVVSKFAEEAKVAVRNVRRDANDHTKANKELTEDMQKNCLEKVQKTTDEFIKIIDENAKNKEKEIMTI